MADEETTAVATLTYVARLPKGRYEEMDDAKLDFMAERMDQIMGSAEDAIRLALTELDPDITLTLE